MNWIGCSVAQRRSPMALVADNSRFLILSGVDYLNLATAAPSFFGNL